MATWKVSLEGKSLIMQALKRKGWNKSSPELLIAASKVIDGNFIPSDPANEEPIYANSINNVSSYRFFAGHKVNTQAFKAYAEALDFNQEQIERLRIVDQDEPTSQLQIISPPSDSLSSSKILGLTKLQEQSINKLESGCRYEKLFGRDKETKTILEYLLKERGRGILSIDGIGGVGKTALAREIAIHALKTGEFESVVWESAKLQEMGTTGRISTIEKTVDLEYLLEQIAIQINHLEINAIRGLDEKTEFIKDKLQKKSYLIVIDNLETIENYAKLVDHIQGLFSVSKALITTRNIIGASNNVKAFPIHGLACEDSIGFFRTYAEQCGFRAEDEVAGMSDDRIAEIHELVGGLPLAIELIVGQLGIGKTLNSVVSGLQSNNYKILDKVQADDEDIFREFYLHLFQSSWSQLNDYDQKVLFSFTGFDSVKSGVESKRLFEIAKELDVNANEFDISIARLIQFSLIKKERGNTDAIYYLHPLTNQFIQELE